MVFRKRSNRQRREPTDGDQPDYEKAARDRLRSIGESGGYSYRSEEGPDVEARLRRMFYGAKVEGSKAVEDDDDSTPTDPTST